MAEEGNVDLIVVDAGQSSTKIALVSGGELGESRRLGPVYTDRPLGVQIAQRILEFESSQTGKATSVVVSSTGVVDAHQLAQDVSANLMGSTLLDVAVVHDSIGAYSSTLGTKPGVMVAAGTGIVTLGLSDRLMSRVDGWGYSMGDSGSGFWIGRAGMHAAMEAYDGRGPDTALLERLRRHFESPETAYIELQNDSAWVARTAKFSEEVFALADVDTVARELVKRASKKILLSAQTALKKVGLHGDNAPRVALVGAIFLNSLISSEVKAGILKSSSGAVFISQENSLAGLHELIGLPETHPFKGSVGMADVQRNS